MPVEYACPVAKNTFLVTKSEAQAFPCFDEPALKATYEVTLIADKNLTCLSNMDVKSEEDASSGKKKVHFNKSPPMSTYVCIPNKNQRHFF